MLTCGCGLGWGYLHMVKHVHVVLHGESAHFSPGASLGRAEVRLRVTPTLPPPDPYGVRVLCLYVSWGGFLSEALASETNLPCPEALASPGVALAAPGFVPPNALAFEGHLRPCRNPLRTSLGPIALTQSSAVKAMHVWNHGRPGGRT